jgi:hypothetical protein
VTSGPRVWDFFHLRRPFFSRMDIGRQVQGRLIGWFRGNVGSSSGLGSIESRWMRHRRSGTSCCRCKCINYGIRDNLLDFCRSPVRRLGVFGDGQFVMRSGDESDWNLVVRTE